MFLSFYADYLRLAAKRIIFRIDRLSAQSLSFFRHCSNFIFDCAITVHVLDSSYMSVIYDGTWSTTGAVSISSVIEKYDAIEYYRVRIFRIANKNQHRGNLLFEL